MADFQSTHPPKKIYTKFVPPTTIPTQYKQSSQKGSPLEKVMEDIVIAELSPDLKPPCQKKTR